MPEVRGDYVIVTTRIEGTDRAWRTKTSRGLARDIGTAGLISWHMETVARELGIETGSEESPPDESA